MAKTATSRSSTKGLKFFVPWQDELGPAKILYLRDTEHGLQGIVVLDNLRLGPAIGGVRMLPDVTPYEIFCLARSMTLKSAAAGVPHGGGKAGILADPSRTDREVLMRAFARGIRGLTEYIPAPDMGTDEHCMELIHQEIGRAAGLPRSLGGIPLNEIGATGFGLSECAQNAAAYLGLDLTGARVVVEGFGHVGEHTARFLAQKGCSLIGASDIMGTVYNPCGLDPHSLAREREKAGSIAGVGGCERLSRDAIFSLPCDIFVAAARCGTLTTAKAEHLQTRLVLEGANLPATKEAEAILHHRRVLVIPDFIANAGGLICASVEYGGGTQDVAFRVIAEKIRNNTSALLDRVYGNKTPPRRAAVALALDRLRDGGEAGDTAWFEATRFESTRSTNCGSLQ